MPPQDKIKFSNVARHVGLRHNQDWYEWIIYVDEKKDTLEKIDFVEYLLHPSFSNPLQKRKNKEEKFALKSSGWGEFYVKITVFFKDRSRLDTSYYLDLSKPWNSNLFKNK